MIVTMAMVPSAVKKICSMGVLAGICATTLPISTANIAIGTSCEPDKVLGNELVNAKKIPRINEVMSAKLTPTKLYGLSTPLNNNTPEEVLKMTLKIPSVSPIDIVAMLGAPKLV